MAYTYDQLVRAWTDVHIGVKPNAQTLANMQIQVGMNAGGQLGDAQLLSMIVNSADDTTAVAVMTYQFFTGKSPTKAGLDYLVNSPTNFNDLNDAYYSKFNLENRFINFAANLGVYGEGAKAFGDKYGAMDFSDYVASIYQTIIGSSYASAAGIDVPAAIAYLIGTKDAVRAIAQSAGMITASMTDAQTDLAVKAAMAGLVMAASIKADVGLYAAATDNFMLALMTGTAVYNTNITVTYAPSPHGTDAHGTGRAVDRGTVLPTPTSPTPTGPVSHAFLATVGNDHFTGGDLADTFSATNLTFGAGDVLDGAGGADHLTLTSTGGAFFVAPSATVSSIETATVTSDDGIDLTTTGWTGLTTLDVTCFGGASVIADSTTEITLNVTQTGNDSVTARGGTMTVNTTNVVGAIAVESSSPNGVVTVNSSSDRVGRAGPVSTVGGETVIVTQIATNAVNTTHDHGAVHIEGSHDTTSVTVSATPTATADATHAGVNQNVVQIIDREEGTGVLGSITTVSIDGFAEVRFGGTALSTLTLAHGAGNANGSGDIVIANHGMVAPVVTTLNLVLNDVTGGALSDANVYTTLNITTGAVASSLTNIVDTALTTLTVSGSSLLTLTSTAGATNLATVIATGAAGLTGDFSQHAITYTGGSGADTVGVGDGANSIDVGSGLDRVDITAVNLSSNSVFTSITGMDAGDVVSLAGLNNANVMGAQITGQTTLAAYLDAAAADNAPIFNTLHWFVFGGDTYIVSDVSAAATFVAGADAVVKLVGTHDLSTATAAAGVITL